MQTSRKQCIHPKSMSKANCKSIGVSIIIPCRNEIKYIEYFIISLLKQDYSLDNLEVIVADGMSEDGTRGILEQICKKHNHIRMIDNPLKIVSSGLNLAISIAKYDIIMRMDVHTEYAEDYISKCVETLIQTRAGNVGGPARTRAESFLQSAIASAYHSRFAVGGASFHFADFEGEVDTLPYGCWQKETLIKIGLFDEMLVRNQDDELNYRLIKAGYKIWQNPNICSWYYPRNSLRKLFIQYYQYGYWKVKVIRKYHRPAAMRHLLPGAFIVALLFSAVLTEFIPNFRWILYLVLATYLLFVLVGTVIISMNSSWRYFCIMPLILTTFHTSYGMGFIYSLMKNATGFTNDDILTTKISH